MKRIEVKLSLPVVAPLLDVVRELALELEERLPAEPRVPESDPELREAWIGELQAIQNADIRALLGLFDGEFFTDGVVALEEVTCEPIVRATAVLRLHLRGHRLASISDETLEAGEVEMAGLSETARKAFMCYLFLATLQELIVHNLDPADNRPE